MPLVTLSVDGVIATLTLAAPPEGVGRAFMDALRGACETLADATDRVYAVVVTADGEDFATGWSAEALAEAAGAGGLVAPLGATSLPLRSMPACATTSSREPAS